MRTAHLIAALALGVGVLQAGAAGAQAPQWFMGQWILTGPSTVAGESPYEIKYLFTPDRVTHMTRGGPADSAKGIVCAVGFSTSYRIIRQTSSSVTIEMSAANLSDLYKPSQYCFQRYVKAGMYPPQTLTITSRDGGETMSLGGRLVYTRKRVDPVATPSEWCKSDAGCITAWGDMVLGSMRR